MRLQSTHPYANRALDAYFSPPEATISLIHIESSNLPRFIWEPAAGDGAIVRPLKKAGFTVVASDIADYGLDNCTIGVDYLKAVPPAQIQGIVTNPPYKLAVPFAEKAIREVRYLALLLRTNFLESTARLSFFRRNPPARIWISSRRLPMMHRYGWAGPRAPSNTCFAWFIWDSNAKQKQIVDWFDWKNISKSYVKTKQPGASKNGRQIYNGKKGTLELL
jgi:hypothetical protein